MLSNADCPDTTSTESVVSPAKLRLPTIDATCSDTNPPNTASLASSLDTTNDDCQDCVDCSLSAAIIFCFNSLLTLLLSHFIAAILRCCSICTCVNSPSIISSNDDMTSLKISAVTPVSSNIDTIFGSCFNPAAVHSLHCAFSVNSSAISRNRLTLAPTFSLPKLTGIVASQQ